MNSLKAKYVNELDITEEEIERKIEERNQAKKDKNFELADKIRDELSDAGIILNDTREGTKWIIKKLYNVE